MVDKTIILRKLSDLDTYLDQIEQYADVSIDAYRSEWKTQRIVERTLQMMIETCADIANHIISDSKMRSPTSYADTFKVLNENTVIDPGLSANMEKMSKFRNVVVHQYEDVDAGIVMTILRTHLADFKRYRDAVLTFLNRA